MNTYAQNQSKGTFHVFRLKPHEDLKRQIMRFASDHQIKAGAVVSCAGSLEVVELRFANQEKGTRMNGFFEILSLSGTFSDTSSHIHMSVSDQKGQTFGGHLLDGNLIYTTAEIVVVELTELEFRRETDSTYGYQELSIKRKNP